MGKAIATISGVALAPGVSRNGRLYTRDAISRAVMRAQERIAAGKRPIAMYTHHDTRNTADIAGGVTKMWQDESGAARYEARITDTKAGRDIATLADPGPDGDQAVLRGLSIRGDWLGPVRHVRVGGQLADTADDLEISRLDWTSEPGVDDAGVDSFALAGAGEDEDSARYGISETAPDALLTITEDVQEARVTAIAEEAGLTREAAVPAGLAETMRVILAAPHAVDEDGTPPVPERDSGLSGGGRPWADPGYQADRKQRYDLSTKAKAKAAWSYINQAGNAEAYTGPQLKRIKGRIMGALKSFGVAVAAEGWTVEPAFEVTEDIAEYFGSPECSGSYSLTATNGPTTVTVCSYGLDPADLRVILARACGGAGMALASLDPDMDGDIDVPGADAEDTDHDHAGESAPDEQVAETSTQDPAPEPVAEPQEDKEVPAMTDTATAVEASPAAPASITLTESQFAALLERATPRPAPAAETAPATPVTETDDERIARMVDERTAARIAAETVAETEEQRISRLVEARVAQHKQEMIASGQVVPGRRGLEPSGAVDEHTARVTPDGGGEYPPAPPGKSWDEMHKWSTEELNQYATPQIASYIFKR